MNKGIYVLSLGVILAAMVLIMVTNRAPLDQVGGNATAEAPASVRQPVSPDPAPTPATQERSSETRPSTSVPSIQDGTDAAGLEQPTVPRSGQGSGSNKGQGTSSPERADATPSGAQSKENGSGNKTAEKPATGQGKPQTAARGKGTAFFDIPEDVPAKPEKPKPKPKGENLDKTVTIADRGKAGDAAAKPSPKPEASSSSASDAAEKTKAAAGPVDGPRGVSLHFSENGMIVRIRSDKAFGAKAFVLEGPDRLVIDLTGDFSWLTAPSVPSNTLIKGVRIGQQPKATRLVLDLTRPAKKFDRKEFSSTNMEVHVE